MGASFRHGVLLLLPLALFAVFYVLFFIEQDIILQLRLPSFTRNDDNTTSVGLDTEPENLTDWTVNMTINNGGLANSTNHIDVEQPQHRGGGDLSAASQALLETVEDGVDSTRQHRKFIATCTDKGAGRFTNNLWILRRLLGSFAFKRTIVYPELEHVSAELMIDIKRAPEEYHDAFVTSDEFQEEILSLSKIRPVTVALYREDHRGLDCWSSFLSRNDLNFSLTQFQNPNPTVSLINNETKNHDIVLIGGTAVFVLNANVTETYEYLHYHQSIEDSAREIVDLIRKNDSDTLANSGTLLGVHLRLEDFKRIGKALPLNSTVSQIRDLVIERNVTSILLCSNGNHDELQYVQRKLKGVVNVIQFGCPVDKIPICKNSTFAAAVEQVALSFTDVYIGTPGSSFSHEVWKLRRLGLGLAREDSIFFKV